MKVSTENPLKVVRERLLISRSELAGKANISFMTVQRIEKGKPCRLDTKGKIAAALGFNSWLDNKGNSSSEL